MTSHHLEEDCPICGGPGSYVFDDSHRSAIYHCAESICGHLWTNSLKSDHGVTSRDPVIQAETDQYLAISGERNKRLLRFFLRRLGKTKNLRFLDFGAGNAHISRSFKQLLGERVQITCLEKAGLEPIDFRLCPHLELGPSSQSKWDAYLVEIGYKQMSPDQIPYANEDILWLRDLRFKIQSIFRGQQKPRHYPHQLAGFTRLKLTNGISAK